MDSKTSSKYFKDFIQADKLPNEKFHNKFSFTMNNVPIGIKFGLCLKRIVQMKIKRYAPIYKTFNVQINTTNYIEEILDNIARVHFSRKIMEKLDLNVYELSLDVENKTNKKLKAIKTSDFVFRNIEEKVENKTIPIDELLMYENDLLFYLKYGKRFKLTCKVGGFTKKESSAINQGGRLSPSYYADVNENINQIIFHNSENFCSCSNKELISMGFDIMKNDILDIKNTLLNNNNDFYIEMTTIPVFDIVINNIDSGYSQLISAWITHHDSLAISTTKNNNKIICYGLCKYKNMYKSSNSKSRIDEKEFKKIKNDTIKTFIEHITRLHKYIMILESDWKKVKLQKTVPIYPDYYNMYILSRTNHRKKEKERKTTIYS